jgi:DNA-binding transcriptional ArsR family regulator
MVKYLESSLDDTFAALSDPIRRAILSKLSTGEKSVTDLAKPFPISMPAVLKHLAYLEKAGLVAGAKKGRVRRFQLVAAPMQNAAEWIADYKKFWEQQFDQLEKYLNSQTKEESWQQQKQHKKQRSRSEGPSTHPEKGSTTRGRNSTK